MSSPALDSWWSDWLDVHGRDSEEEAAFLGYLSTQGIAAHGVDPGELAAAYAAFKTFMGESQARESADPGPSAMEMGIQDPVVPKSHVANPSVQRPVTDATHPQQMSSPGATASPRQVEAARVRVQAATQSGAETPLPSEGSPQPPPEPPASPPPTPTPRHAPASRSTPHDPHDPPRRQDKE
jgi:hypothetical protein